MALCPVIEFTHPFLSIFRESIVGASLSFVKQDPSKIRRWLNGSPYGQVDLIPAFTDPDILAQYKVLFLLDWNTMTEEIFEGLKKYVEQGGNLILGISQLSTLTTRQHLKKMDELNLIYDGKGKIEELFGAKITGKGNKVTELSFVNASENGLQFDAQNTFPTDETPVEAPEIHLATVENKTASVLAKDEKGNPALIENRCGKGYAYLVTLWNYPGNERLEKFMTEVVGVFATRFQSDIKVLDNPDIHFSRYEENDSERVLLLNTDWTDEGNVSTCKLSVKGEKIEIKIKNDQITTVIYNNGLVIVPLENDLFIEKVEHKDGKYNLKIHGAGQYNILIYDFESKVANASCDGQPCSIEQNDTKKTVMVNLNKFSTAILTLEK